MLKIFENLIEKQLSFFWRPEEVDLASDRKDFMDLPEHEKHIFVSNLKYQTLLDSVQGRSPNVALLPVTAITQPHTLAPTFTSLRRIPDTPSTLAPVLISASDESRKLVAADPDDLLPFFFLPLRSPASVGSLCRLGPPRFPLSFVSS